MAVQPLSDRFTILDGMRGIAAIAVVVGHTSHQKSGVTFNTNMDLAVPFFFALSGFVLSHAYSGKLNNFNELIDYFLHRIIRLLPLVILAGIFGSTFLQYRFVHNDLTHVSLLHIISAQILSLTTIPTPFLDIDRWRWPVNPPEWSLFCEFAASALLALVLIRVNMLVLQCISGMGYALSIAIDYKTGAISPGLSGEAALTLFSFTSGCILHRIYNKNKNVGFLMGSFVPIFSLSVILFVPIPMNTLSRSLVLGLLIPSIIYLSAQSEALHTTREVARVFGELSYPIYILHWPTMLWIEHIFPDMPAPYFVMTVVSASLGLAHIALVSYDRPIRRKLRGLADRQKLHSYPAGCR